MGERIKVTAPAKINFHLDVLNKRDDGYHNLKMIMQALSFQDIIYIEKTNSGKVILKSDEKNLPDLQNNIINKAINLFYKENNIKLTGLDIFVEKNIPMNAGLGGGSADAAAILTALNFLEKTNMGILQLQEMGAKIGADVPFVFSGATKFVEGIGEQINDLPLIQDCFILIIKPQYDVFTKEAFSKIDNIKIKKRPDMEGAIRFLKNKDLIGFAKSCCNVFEEVIECEEVFKIKDKMISLGAVNSSMTGSGPSVFGIFETEIAVARAFDALKQEYKNIFIAKPIDCGVKVLLK